MLFVICQSVTQSVSHIYMSTHGVSARHWDRKTCTNRCPLNIVRKYGKNQLHYITLHKIVFRVPKITRTARTLYEIKEVIWEYSYEGKHLGMLSAMLITVNLLPYQHFSPSDYLYMGTLINELLGLPCVLCFSVDPIGLRSGLQMSLWPGTVIPQWRTLSSSRVWVSKVSAYCFVSWTVCSDSQLRRLSIPVAAVRIWNSLPQHITSAPSLPVFCSRLKTYFFELCYP